MSKVKDPRVKRHNARWTQDEVDTLVQMIIDGATTAEVARRLGRTKASVWTRKNTLKLGPDVRLANSRGANMPVSIGTKVRRTKEQMAKSKGPGRPKGSKNKEKIKPAQTPEGIAQILEQAKALGMKVTITLS